MKKLLLILLFIYNCCNAQNYPCLQAGVKHYFINGNGYLRGIRIDSVQSLGDTIVYYVFHTPRGSYDIGMGASVMLDSNGGSWLGKRVLQLSDGSFIFDSYWNDSVIIKTQANVGDNWVFYSDTSNLYYTATVTGIDTMSIGGAVDSIKNILITAHNPSGIVITDPVDSFQIILSKNNGFVQIMDLYTFPYHRPSAIYTHGLDYFLDKIISTFTGPNVYNSIFNLTVFSSPSFSQLYQWNVGDVYEYSTCNTTPEPYCLCNPAGAYYMDTITAINITSGTVQYSYSGWKSSMNINALGAFEGYSIAPDNGILTCGLSLLISTTLMPEEFKLNTIYYYWPDDTSFCIRNPLYETNASDIYDGQYNPPFEWTDPVYTYKSPLGLLYAHHCYSGTGSLFDVDDQTLIYSVRGGIPCNTFYIPTSIANLNNSGKAISAYPNPATTSLTISSSDKINQITISNLVGQIVYNHEYNSAAQVQVNVAALSAGVYFVKINGLDVRKFVKE